MKIQGSEPVVWWFAPECKFELYACVQILTVGDLIPLNLPQAALKIWPSSHILA